MSKEKQILQMLQNGYSQRRIASTLRVSRNTVARVVKAASDHGLSKDALESMEETELHHTLFPEEAMLPTLVTPDFPYIHKELLKNGVTLKLLWQEYVDNCGMPANRHMAIPNTVSYIRIMSCRISLPCISNLNLFTKFTIDMHGSTSFLLILLDVIAELRIHERLIAVSAAVLHVFRP